MSNTQSKKDGFSIKLWAEDDRPREKLMAKGRHALTDAELIAILIGSGSSEESAIQLSQRILKEAHNDLNRFGKLTLKELISFKGIGKAKAISILAAMELGRRRRDTDSSTHVKITTSQTAFELLFPLLTDLDHEQFYVVLLNRANVVVDTVKISQGGVSGTVADSKLIFKSAIDRLASAIILAHNHPSGNLQPSQADIQLTKRMKEAGKLLDVSVLDHLIVAGNEYYSFADEGMM